MDFTKPSYEAIRQATKDVATIHAAGRWPDFQDELYAIRQDDRQRKLAVTLRQKLLATEVAANVSNLTGAGVWVCEEAALEEVTGTSAILDELHKYAERIRREAKPAIKVRRAV